MNYGIPYMGSKSDIVHQIALMFPKRDNFYDLFGGGFCVTHYMITKCLHKYKEFYFNEIACDTVDLIKDAIAGKYSYDVFKPEFIDRETFLKNKDKCAYTRICWSFGNDQRHYLFREDIEEQKKSLHNAVVFNVFDNFAKKFLSRDIFPDHLSITQKRLIARHCGVKRREQLQQLERLEQLEQLERLERLQQLERLERLEHVTKVNFSALSYDEVQIKPNSFLYCDIPYKGTAKYVGEFNHDKFYEWALRQTEPVIISEYSMPKDFKEIYRVDKKSKLSPIGSSVNSVEKLFANNAACKVLNIK